MPLAACAALRPGADDLAAIDRIAGEVLSASHAPLAEQKSALGRAQAAFAQAPGAANRLRLATLLATLPGPLRDDGRALELLEPMAGPATPYGRYAALLSAQLAEHQRLAREHERSSKESAQREAELRQQLDALRAIERGILEREDKLRGRPPRRP